MNTVPESHRDLLEVNLATLATVGPDGRPQMSTVWFLGTSGSIQFSLNTARQKTKNLLANPKVTVHIIDPNHEGRYLEVRGDVTTEPDPDYVFADQLAVKYGSPDVRQFDKPGESRVVVTVNPVRVNAIQMW